MNQTLYGDVLFLVNLTMDYLTLFITLRLLHRPLRPWRLLFGAAIGGVYGVAACFMGGPLIFRIGIDIAVSLLMCYITYGERLLPCMALFYGIGCLLGGMMTALYTTLDRMTGVRTVYVDGAYRSLAGDLPLGWAAIVALLALSMALFFGRLEKQKRAAREIMLTIQYGENAVHLTGMVDSGNLLTDPLSGKPVILLTEQAFLRLLPDDAKPLFAGDTTPDLSLLHGTILTKFRLLPYEGAGGGGLLCGLSPDEIILDSRKVSAMIGKSTGQKNFAGCDALIPATLLR